MTGRNRRTYLLHYEILESRRLMSVDANPCAANCFADAAEPWRAEDHALTTVQNDTSSPAREPEVKIASESSPYTYSGPRGFQPNPNGPEPYRLWERGPDGQLYPLGEGPRGSRPLHADNTDAENTDKPEKGGEPKKDEEGNGKTDNKGGQGDTKSLPPAFEPFTETDDSGRKKTGVRKVEYVDGVRREITIYVDGSTSIKTTTVEKDPKTKVDVKTEKTETTTPHDRSVGHKTEVVETVRYKKDRDKWVKDSGERTTKEIENGKTTDETTDVYDKKTDSWKPKR